MEKLTEAERVVHSVVRAFLRDIGWRPGDYTAATIGQPEPSEEKTALMSEMGRSLAAASSDSASCVDALLSLGWSLDQRAAPLRLLEPILPKWLTDQSAAACLVLARALLRSGEQHRAIAMFRRAVAIAPLSGRLHRELGLALRQQRRLADALQHIEVSLAFRGAIQSDLDVQSTVPLLVAQANKHVNIYFCKGRYYLVHRRPDLVGARVVGGELLAIRRNAGYYCVRSILHAGPVRRLMAAFRAGRAASRRQAVNTRPSKMVAGVYGRQRSVATLAAKWTNAALRRLALWTVARPIEHSADTITEAMELSHSLFGESHPSQADVRLVEASKV